MIFVNMDTETSNHCWNVRIKNQLVACNVAIIQPG